MYRGYFVAVEDDVGGGGVWGICLPGTFKVTVRSLVRGCLRSIGNMHVLFRDDRQCTNIETRAEKLPM